MFRQTAQVLSILVVTSALTPAVRLNAQEPAAPAKAPELQQGVEVQARGPVHEAFATPTAASGSTPLIAKKPPANIDELAPEERPEGEVVWIGGYWAWDDDRTDFLWVSGCWRAKPPGKDWVAGYWREQGEQWQWVGGFWTAQAQQQGGQEVTYLPEPPKAPAVAPPAEQPPTEDSFYVPGHWVWSADRYAWRAGYWGRVQPGHVWVAAHYRWTPSGYIYIQGYWDVAIARRGVLYAPVYVDPAVLQAGYVYTPVYAVPDAVVVDTLFVRPSHGIYYFGDYYGPRYRTMGYESCYVYSRTNYDCIITYQRYEYRREPNWFEVRVELTNNRNTGRAPLPPRTLVQQNTIIQQNVVNQTVVNNNTTVINNNSTTINKTNTTNNMQMIATASQVAAARGQKTVAVPPEQRAQAKLESQAGQQVAMQQRKQAEVPTSTPLKAPRTTALAIPPTRTTASAPPQTSVQGNGGKQPLSTTAGNVPITQKPGLPANNAGVNPLAGNAQKPAATLGTGPAVNPGITQKPGTTVAAQPGTGAQPANPGTALKPVAPLAQPTNPQQPVTSAANGAAKPVQPGPTQGTPPAPTARTVPPSPTQRTVAPPPLSPPPTSPPPGNGQPPRTVAPPPGSNQPGQRPPQVTRPPQPPARPAPPHDEKEKKKTS